MSETKDANAAPLDEFAAARANFSETAKWVIGGLLTTAIAVLAGSPLTKLGSLEWGSRLVTAILAATIAFAVLGLLLWLALGVIAADAISPRYLAQQTWLAGERVKRMERRLSGQLPPGFNTFREIANHASTLLEASSKGEAESKANTAFGMEIAKSMPLIKFEYRRQRFIELRNMMFVLMPVVIASVGLFAWAANPPAEPRSLSEKPRLTEIAVDPQSVVALGAAVPIACYERMRDGGAGLKVLVLDELDGWSELVVLPSPGCLPTRLREQNRRLFVVN